jgi:hypothetical protein
MRATTLLMLYLAGAVLLPATAHADAALDRIKARGKLVVSVKNESARRQSAHKDPAHFAKRDFEIALARAIAHAQVRLETVLLDIVRGVQRTRHTPSVGAQRHRMKSQRWSLPSESG